MGVVKLDGTIEIIWGDLIMPGDGRVEVDGKVIARRKGDEVEYKGQKIVVPVGKTFIVDGAGRIIIQ